MKDHAKKDHKAKKAHKKVRISPKYKNQVFFADTYDRTPPPIDVFECDGGSCKNKYILNKRYHCQKCADFDLCHECATGDDMAKHEHSLSDFEIILPDKEEE